MKWQKRNIDIFPYDGLDEVEQELGEHYRFVLGIGKNNDLFLEEEAFPELDERGNGEGEKRREGFVCVLELLGTEIVDFGEVEYCVGFEFGCDSSPIFGYEV
jgi:hypothetical protein